MPTATTLIGDALGLLGIVDPVDPIEAEDSILGLRTLNRLIDSLNGQQSMLYAVQYVSFSLPASTNTRTIGATGDVVASRPVRVETGGYASISGIDYEIIPVTRERYAEISLKTIGSVAPQVVYYEAGMPNGTLYFWPPVGGAATIKLPLSTKITAFADLTTEYLLPEGYEDMLVNNLAIKLQPFYKGSELAGSVVAEARRLKAQIKKANMQAPSLETDLPTSRTTIGGLGDLGNYL